MRIIMKVSPEDREAGRTPDDLAMALFARASETYNEYADDKEAYLMPPDGLNPVREQLELLDGAEAPADLCAEAAGWDAALSAAFEKALAKALYEQDPNFVGQSRWLGVPPNPVYELKKAAMALDNDFYSFAEQALLVNDKGFFTTRLYTYGLKAILDDPGSYAAITVYPK